MLDVQLLLEKLSFNKAERSLPRRAPSASETVNSIEPKQRNSILEGKGEKAVQQRNVHSRHSPIDGTNTFPARITSKKSSKFHYFQKSRDRLMD